MNTHGYTDKSLLELATLTNNSSKGETIGDIRKEEKPLKRETKFEDLKNN